MARIAKRPGKPRPLSYSVFGFQGANTPPNVIDGVDGIHHSAISGQTVEVIRHLPDGVPEGIEGVRRHVSSRSVSRRHIQLQIGILESKHDGFTFAMSKIASFRSLFIFFTPS